MTRSFTVFGPFILCSLFGIACSSGSEAGTTSSAPGAANEPAPSTTNGESSSATPSSSANPNPNSTPAPTGSSPSPNPAPPGALLLESPANVNATAGGHVELVAKVAPGSSVQWLRDGVEMAGETNEKLVFASAKLRQHGDYTIRVSDGTREETGSASLRVMGLEHLAGTTGGSGYVDGSFAKARFARATGVASDAAGNLFVADSENHVIRKIDTNGNVTTIAGVAGSIGSADGNGAFARFDHPRGIVVAPDGTLFVTEQSHIIRKIATDGTVTTFAGVVGVPGHYNAIGTAAKFNMPTGIAVENGALYVTDYSSCTVRKVDITTRAVSTLAGTGACADVDGAKGVGQLKGPNSIAWSGSMFYVTDFGSNHLRTLMPDGTLGTVKNAAAVPLVFKYPQGVTVSSTGNVIVSYDECLALVTNAIAPIAGKCGTKGGVDGVGTAARFDYPRGMTALDGGAVAVADWANSAIRRVAANGTVTTLAGATLDKSSVDGAGDGARFKDIIGAATTADGFTYVAESSCIRAMTSNGNVATLAGDCSTNTDPIDGVGSQVRFDWVRGIATTPSGDALVIDGHSIRKITKAGVVTSIAGNSNVPASVDASGTSARFFYPNSLVVDANGDAYVLDNETLRKMTPAGMVTTIAGLYLSPTLTDGTGSAARFSYPTQITESNGDLYVYDDHTIRRVTKAGVVTTIIGAKNALDDLDGTGLAARLINCLSLTTDPATGDLLFTSGRETLRRMTLAGVVTTIAGNRDSSAWRPGGLPGGFDGVVALQPLGGGMFLTGMNGRLGAIRL